eukprot:4635145-Heterocapsa_arctica.AAC.1
MMIGTPTAFMKMVMEIPMEALIRMMTVAPLALPLMVDARAKASKFLCLPPPCHVLLLLLLPLVF